MNKASLVGHVLELLELVDRSTQPPDHIVSDFFKSKKYLGSHDRRFISETVFGMIRHRRFLEALLEQYVSLHPAEDSLDATRQRYLSLFVVYGVAVQNHIENSQPASGVVPESYWKTYFPKFELQSFIEWILSNKTLGFLEDDAVVQLGVRYSFLEWMIEEWQHQIGDEVEELLAACNSPAPVTLRVNLTKVSREDCMLRLRAEGVEATPTRLSQAGLISQKRFNQQALQSFKDGWFEMQDEGSQIVSFVLNPRPGEIIIDGCAGAGGKTLHAADLMKEEGEIIAIDVDAKRLSELRRRAERAGTRIIRTIVRDELRAEDFYGKADRVLVDAPCSGVGTIRRNPGFKWSVTESLVEHYAGLQKEILQFNSQLVKPDGLLIYTTCSLFQKENEDVVDNFLSQHNEFEITKPDISAFNIHTNQNDQFVKLFPHRYGTDGFFIAAMKRRP